MRQRRAISIGGTVQGVGFRPFVHGLAARLQLAGFVRNFTGGVQIEAEGEEPILDEFLSLLTTGVPPLARIESFSWRPLAPLGDSGFRIEQSDFTSPGPVVISPDVATCGDCLKEMLDPANRRYKYPFINCTNCGPRLTIVTGSPYDRQRTTMVGFEMCEACREEYESPSSRRFHAQPIACAKCGPSLRVLDSSGRNLQSGDPISAVFSAISEGKIAAIKGLGGYHLVCDATNKTAVAQLRQRKHREERAFAVMVRDIAATTELCEVGEPALRLLASSARPIVLLRKRHVSVVAEEVAPQNPFLGVMLPYTPLHYLLLGDLPMVMTSGNQSDEPIAIDEADALERLAGIADLFLVHNRPIHVRCDDSVTRIVGGNESLIRRSRGYAPRPISLPFSCDRPILAVGAELKSTFALGSNRQAIVSHHMGDLEHLQAFKAFERDVALYEQLFSIRPKYIVHDLHPDYASTRYAIRRAAKEGLICIAIQHHHAHLASCMAEHELTQPVIGVTFDGTGFGTDRTIWGGEFLIGDCNDFQRAAHLRCIAMPGGDAAARNPWRMALSHLIDGETTCSPFEKRQSAASLKTIRQMIERRFNSPQTSSMGRLFDAVASLAGVRDSVAFEGQAAMELEWLATSVPADGCYPFDFTESVVDTRPLIRAVAADAVRGVAPALIARRFHSTVVEISRTVCRKLRETSGINIVVLTGGVFMNALLVMESTSALEQEAFGVYGNVKVPPNDGGISLGQLAVAASRLSRSR